MKRISFAVSVYPMKMNQDIQLHCYPEEAKALPLPGVIPGAGYPDEMSWILQFRNAPDEDTPDVWLLGIMKP